MMRWEAGELAPLPKRNVPRELDRLGVDSAYPIADDGSGIIYRNGAGWSGSAGAPQLASWVEDMLGRHDDVARKLESHPTRDGHAFLWATMSSDYETQFCPEDRRQDLPQDSPRLPNGVTHVWVGGLMSSQGVLAWFPDRGWWRTPWKWPTSREQLP